MHTKVELFTEPLDIKKTLNLHGSEMSNLQHALLCGLIKQYKPKKIVEVGVAAGGTTAVILNCISTLKLHSVLYSVDKSENYYRDSNKKTGYLAEECKRYINEEIEHHVFFGGYLPEYIDKIGNDIDLLILDTMHILPGELLDFLVCLPRMSNKSVVILHDILLNHLSVKGNTNCIATRVLLSSVCGKKIVCRGNDNQYNYIGLGGFEVTKETRNYVENVFLALSMTWDYMPDAEQIQLYREQFTKYYNNDLVEEFNMAVEMNNNTLLKRRMICKEGLCNIHKLLNKLENKKNIFIYGCGTYGTMLYDCLESFGIDIQGYVISDNQVKPDINKRIEYFSDIQSGENTLVFGMSSDKQREICREFVPENWINVDEKVFFFLKNCL